MKTEFTPGPWSLSTIPFELRNSDDAASIWKDTLFGKEVGSAPICNVSRAVGDEQATANARLIASAPELLEALIEAQQQLAVLKGVLTNPRQIYATLNIIDRCGFAIAKAGGIEG